jgi:hypothetical protein
MKEIPQWQQDLVLDRIERGRLHPERMLDWNEVCKTLATGQVKRKSNIKELKFKAYKTYEVSKLRKSG